MPEKEKEQIVNQAISEVARAYPGCKVSTEYIKAEPMEKDESKDTYHLLWASDRIEIARQVETRLSQIYADLVSLEKMMHYKLSILDVWRRYGPYIDDQAGRRSNILQEAHHRWMKNARLKKDKPIWGGNIEINWGDLIHRPGFGPVEITPPIKK